MVMFGTNRPSMTSTCTQSHPAWSMARISSPNLEKSAERMDGDTTTERLSERSTREVADAFTPKLLPGRLAMAVRVPKRASVVLAVARMALVAQKRRRFQASLCGSAT